jgi:hypothetical protein
METPFNINNYIKVRLTDRGRAVHRENYERLFHGHLIEKYPYQPPAEDKDGWSKWQAWDFMASFGPYMGNGLNAPAETEIKFITD